ncbi:probable pectinesterase 15 [Dendrobium catenatum]|uniref:probable pectinesterase 15 n=1 Tax=Dendrobium catenatum TaxID=906689 RepID=UPI0009F4B0FE|nr:probable pectinesterase 15 [Dendrobium catenatum]
MRRLTKHLLLTSALLTALISIIIEVYFHPSPISTTIVYKSLASPSSIINDFISYFRRHHHHHHRKAACNDSKWSQLIPPHQSGAQILTVDLNGCANFSSVQKAVDAVPDYNPYRTIIIVDSGVYREKVIVWENKTNVTIQGQGYLNTSIVWNDTANSSGGTIYSASVSIFAFNFVAYDISFQNTAPAASPGDVGSQAVALRIAGDQAAFYNCGFYSSQDTLLDDKGRHYFRQCFIQGSIDFIFGNALSLYEECTINSIAKEVVAGVSGCITAQKRESEAERTGFSFMNCCVTGTGRVWLGRAWGSYSTVIFSKTYLPSIIVPEGWDDWNNSSNDKTIFFGEYECCGPGANYTMWPKYAKNLDYSEAVRFMDISFIDGNEWVLPPRSSDGRNPCDNQNYGELVRDY